MLNSAAIEDVLRLIELRSRFDDCQQQLLDMQVENSLLKTANTELRMRVAQADVKDHNRAVGTYNSSPVAISG